MYICNFGILKLSYFSQLEEKIAWLDERMVSSHIQQDTDITDSEVDYESTILNLQDQISKVP